MWKLLTLLIAGLLICSTSLWAQTSILVYATSETTYGYYASSFDEDLPAILAEDGFTVRVTDRMETPEITASLLNGYDQLWIMSTDPYSGSGCFSASEISAIHDFGNTGKGLLIVADDGLPGHDYTGDANQVSTQLGITFSGQYNYGPYAQPFEPDFSAHPLFDGVQTIVCTENAAILGVNPPSEVVATYQGTNMIAVRDDGQGRVVFDVSFMRFWDEDERSGYIPYITVGTTPQYVKNIASWLSGGGQDEGEWSLEIGQPIIKRNGQIVSPPIEIGYRYDIEFSVANTGTRDFVSGSGSNYTIYEEDHCDVGSPNNPLCGPDSDHPYPGWLNYGVPFDPGQPWILEAGQSKTITIEHKFLFLLTDHLYYRFRFIDENGKKHEDDERIPLTTTVSSEALLNCTSTALSMISFGVGNSSGFFQNANSVVDAFKWAECVSPMYSGLMNGLDFYYLKDHLDDLDQVILFIKDGFLAGLELRSIAANCLHLGADDQLDDLLGALAIASALWNELQPLIDEGGGGCGNVLAEAIIRLNQIFYKPIVDLAADFCADHPEVCQTWDFLNSWPIRVWGKCPVDLYVYNDQNDSLVIINNYATHNGIEKSRTTIIDEFKLADLPQGDPYSLVIHGSDYGTMSLCFQFADSDLTYHQIMWENVEVTPTFIGCIHNVTDTSLDQCIVILPLDIESDTSFIYPTFIEEHTQVDHAIVIRGKTISNQLPLQEVQVDLLDREGLHLLSTTTSADGSFEFWNIEPGGYTISFVTPLGYSTMSENVFVSCDVNSTITVYKDFLRIEQIAVLRGRGYWMHQVNALLSGNGNPQETYDEMCEYVELIRTHFNQHGLNPVNVFEVALTDDCDQRLGALRATISPKAKATMNEKARAHLTALLLNMVSGKIAQWHPISEDSLTVSQAITYCNSLITDDNPDNDEIAKDIAEMINEGQLVPAGMIDPSTANIAYKQNDTEQLPTEFSLSQNYPNPFNPVTTISFSLPIASHVSLEVYNVMGQRVTTVADGFYEAGVHACEWDGSAVASGVYFYRIETPEFVETKKMMLLK